MNKSFRFLYFLGSIGIGFLIPIFFAILDLWELNIDVTPTNILEVTQSQNIYLFSLVFFPSTLGLLGFLFSKIHAQNKKLAEEFDYLKLVLNASPDAIIFFNDKLETVFANYEFLKYAIDIDHFIQKADVSMLIQQELELNHREVYLTTKQFDEHPFLLNFRMTEHNGETNYFLSLKDVKGVKEKEAIIDEQRKQMVEKSKLASLGEMASGIAHEVNNPLMVISGNNDLIQKMQEKGKLTPEMTLKLTSVIQKQVDRITSIITALRNLSRGMSNDDKEVFNIKSIIDEAINLAKIKSGFMPIELKNEVKEDIDIYAHQGQVVQVVLNLLANAIDAIGNEEDPWIKIEAEKMTDEKLALYISDCGSGIDQEIVTKIFQPLFTTKEIGKGTGLGLSLSKSFMQQNGGNLTYMTREDHTCFMLTFEIAKSEDDKSDSKKAS